MHGVDVLFSHNLSVFSEFFFVAFVSKSSNVQLNIINLTLKFTSELPWHSWASNQASGSRTCDLGDSAHLLFDELVLFAAHKRQFYPELQRLELLGDCGYPTITRCEHAEDSLKVLLSKGIAVVESGWCVRPG